MSGWRYRPLGPVGSTLEVLAGLCLLPISSRPEPGEPVAAIIVTAVLGGALVIAGLVGLGVQLRRIVAQRSARRS